MQAAEGSKIRQLFEREERDFMLTRARVKMRAPLENIEVGEFKIAGVSEGERAEFPRWVAEELVKLGLAEMEEEPFENEIFRAVTREKMYASPQLSTLNPEFYIRMRRRLSIIGEGVESGKTRREDYERLKSSCYDLIGRRLSKLLSLSSSMTSLETLGDKVTPEEREFFLLCQSISKEWKSALLGEWI